jgi:hypothetical protein
MNASTSLLLTVTANDPMTAKQLASQIGLSESRIRELLTDAVNDGLMVKDDTCRPARFFPTPVADEFIAEELPLSINPFRAFPQQEIAEEISAGVQEPVLLSEIIAALPKARKAPINPQPIIDKKVAVMEAAGGTITYAARTWTITNSSGTSVTLTSKEFSAYKGDEILNVFATADDAA